MLPRDGEVILVRAFGLHQRAFAPVGPQPRVDGEDHAIARIGADTLIIRSATLVQNSVSCASLSGITKTRSASEARSNSSIPSRPSAITII